MSGSEHTAGAELAQGKLGSSLQLTDAVGGAAVVPGGEEGKHNQTPW